MSLQALVLRTKPIWATGSRVSGLRSRIAGYGAVKIDSRKDDLADDELARGETRLRPWLGFPTPPV